MPTMISRKTFLDLILIGLAIIEVAVVLLDNNYEQALATLSSLETHHNNVSGSTGKQFLGEKIRSFDINANNDDTEDAASVQRDNKNSIIIVPDKKESTEILFMVMGQKIFFEGWFDMLNEVDANVSFIYASYDVKVHEEQGDDLICNNDSLFQCKTIFIPGTTWTEGRNLLAEEAIRLERKRGKQFTYWIFTDDDLGVDCRTHAEVISKFYGNEGSCWQHVFDYIGSSKVPEKATTLYPDERAFASVSTADANFAAFKREYVPYLLPYATLPKGESEWLSQGANFCVMRTCMPSSIALIPYIKPENQARRPYPRGFPLDVMKNVIINNYVNEDLGFRPCLDWKRDDYEQLLDEIVTDDIDKLNNLIPLHNLSLCASLKDHFETWEKSVE